MPPRTFGRAMPMMMTAAGTIAPARVFVMGAGVAGLAGDRHRAAAGRHRLRHRRAAGHQGTGGILGATFVAVMDEEFKQAETAAGYAKEMSAEYQAKQAALIAETHQETGHRHHHRPDPRAAGRRVLVTEDMVATMKPGSVIVDLAAEQGGNCPLTQGRRSGSRSHGVTIMGYHQPARAARGGFLEPLCAQPVQFRRLFVDKKTGRSRSTGTTRSSRAPASRATAQIVHPALKG